MDFIEKLDGAVIVTDAEGTLTYMNEKAVRQFEKDGGSGLIGKSSPNATPKGQTRSLRR
ncbi:MAG: PAS domain-containing protein [Marinilabiliales bacterium]|nr:PAS domain-containing protein [Marinilabiliales bacterium]